MPRTININKVRTKAETRQIRMINASALRRYIDMLRGESLDVVTSLLKCLFYSAEHRKTNEYLMTIGN